MIQAGDKLIYIVARLPLDGEAINASISHANMIVRKVIGDKVVCDPDDHNPGKAMESELFVMRYDRQKKLNEPESQKVDNRFIFGIMCTEEDRAEALNLIEEQVAAVIKPYWALRHMIHAEKRKANG